MSETMKKYTQADFDALKRDENGYLHIESGDWTEVNFGGADKLIFADECTLGEWCKLESGRVCNATYFKASNIGSRNNSAYAYCDAQSGDIYVRAVREEGGGRSMSKAISTEQVIKALRCVSTAGGECEEENCPYWVTETLPEEVAQEVGMTEFGACACDEIDRDAANLLEWLSERKTARWLYDKSIGSMGDYCSNCNGRQKVGCGFDYCPQCGAKMGGAEK